MKLSQRMLYEHALTQLNVELISSVGNMASFVEEIDLIEQEHGSTEHFPALQRAFQATVQQFSARPFTDEQIIRLLMIHLGTIRARYQAGKRDNSLFIIPPQRSSAADLSSIACPFCDFKNHLKFLDAAHIECDTCDTDFEASLIIDVK